MRHRLFPRLPQDMPGLIAWLLPLLIFLLLLHPPADPDLWWHLRNGREMVEQRSILTSDRFSYTRFGAPWVNAFWLADLILYAVYRLGGFFGLAVLTALLAALLFSRLGRPARGQPWLRAFLTLLVALAIAPFWSTRPQLASFLLLAWLAGLLERWRGAPKMPFWLPALFLLWANLHGGFIWGFLLILAFLLGEALERLLHPARALPWRSLGALTGWTLLAALVISLNPNGLALWRLPFHTVDVSLGIYEWRSPDFHLPFLHPILWVLLLYLLGLGLRRAPLRLSVLFPILGFAYMGFVSQRALAPFLILLLPSLIETWEEIWEDYASRRPRAPLPSRALSWPWRSALNVSLILGLGLAGLVRAWALSSPEAIHRDYPQGAVQWLRAHHPPGRLFNAYNWGGYLTWNLPEYPVFIDGRADLYGDPLIHQWQQVVNAAPEALTILDQWQVRLVLLEPDQPIVKELQRHGWEIAYQDPLSILLIR